jgi:CLIP-associating protein 1/2
MFELLIHFDFLAAQISSPTIIVERVGSYAWVHKNWKVREEFARTVASAINLFAATELPFQRLLLPSVKYCSQR